MTNSITTLGLAKTLTALIDLVEINKVAIGTLCPASWCTVDLARKHRHRMKAVGICV